MTFKQDHTLRDSIGSLKSNEFGSARLPLLGLDGKPIALPIAVGSSTGTNATVVHHSAKGSLD